DEGPYVYLRSISDQFTAAGAHATFFMNGNNWDCIYNTDRISDVQYAYAAGHMIGSHTWSHGYLTQFSKEQIQDGMFRMEEAFSRILGIKPAFMRPPYGDTDSNVQSIAASRGQSLAMWDTDTGDADGNSVQQSEAVYSQVVNTHVENALILNHETEGKRRSLVPYAINLFQSNGYNLVTMAQCLGVDPYQAIGVPQLQSVRLQHAILYPANHLHSLLGRAMVHLPPVRVAAAPSRVKLVRPYFPPRPRPPVPPALPRRTSTSIPA
ncbi:hypothetical protein B0H12DRAFT_1019516, partial [Mycena haematopus]